MRLKHSSNHSLWHAYHRVRTAVLDLVYPSACIVCKTPGRQSICENCRATLPIRSLTTACSICGGDILQSETAAGTVAPICPQCRAHRPAYDTARSAVAFQGSARTLVHALKYHHAAWIAKPMADYLHAAWIASFGDEIPDLVIPVPLYSVRRFRRTYNQAELLAGSLARKLAVPMAPNLLRRNRNTPTQTFMNAAQRRDNMRNAFSIAKCAPPLLYGKTILLVDDVMTTGSTFDACAYPIRSAGAGRILCLSFARD